MKTIIIASDFSDEAKNATEYAIKMAKKINAKMILFNLHVLSVHTINARLPYDVIFEAVEKSKMKFENYVSTLSKSHNIVLEPYFAMGSFYEQLENAIKIFKADLVVLGMHEKSLEADILGTTTSATIHKLKTPILAIPIHAKFTGIKKILYACDINKGVTSKILEEVKKTTQKLDAELKVFYVKDRLPETEDAKKILEPLKGINYQYESIQSDAVIGEIKKELISFKPDILIMVPQNYGFWSSIIHKSKTRMMSSGLSIPLLSIHG